MLRTSFPRRTRWATTLLGALVLAQGVGKLADVSGYVDALAAFPLVGAGAAPILGPAWMALELVAGLGLLAGGLARHPPVPAARIGAIGALIAALGYAVITGHAYAADAEVANCTCFGVFLPQRLSAWVLLQDAYVLAWAWGQTRATFRWQPARRGGRTEAGALLPDDDNGWKPVGERPIRVLLISGSDRRAWSCPGYDSKARALVARLAAALPRSWEIDTEDLGNVERRARIQSCNACVSTSMALCVWPCNCYRPDHRAVPDLLWDRDLYARLELADAWAIVGPVNWYGPTSNLKLLFDRLVCMNGGNPDESTIDHKDPERAMALERSPAWKPMSVNQLAGRTAAFFAYGDGGGDEIDATGRPKLLHDPAIFDPEREPFDEMRDAYAPLVWQCRYGGVEVPDALWRYAEFGIGRPYSENQVADVPDETYAQFDAWTAAFAEHVGRRGKAPVPPKRAFGHTAPAARIAEVKLLLRAARLALGRLAGREHPAVVRSGRSAEPVARRDDGAAQ